jgi:transposase
MSLKENFPTRIPQETVRFVEPLLSEESIYRFIGQHIDQIISDEDFMSMYAEEGRPAVNPVTLALVTIFQFLEKLPDRTAAQMAVMRLDWKYALRQPLDWTGFHYSDLCNFRKRLLEHEAERVMFERVVAYLRGHGYVQAGGQQRTDSTHILGAVRDLSTVELVRETLRVAVSALISTDALWTLRYLPASFMETYTARQRWDWTDKIQMVEHLQRMATDGEWLWTQVQQFGTPTLRALAEVRMLRRILNEQFKPSRETVSFTPTGHYRGNYIASPYDVDVRRSTKRTTQWVGYKLHVTESISVGQERRFITDIALASAPEPDNQQVEAIQKRLAEQKLLPAQQYVDQGYMSAANLAKSLTRGVNLRGRLLQDTSGKTEGFRLRDFQVDIANRTAICPAGRVAPRFVPAKPNPRNLVAFHVFFGKQCQTCPFFGPELCTDKLRGRHLGVSLHHDLIQIRRSEEQTEAFRQEMRIRAGAESVISELVRGYGARRARYRGAHKNALQVAFTGAALNLKRLGRAVFVPTAHLANLLSYHPLHRFVFQQSLFSAFFAPSRLCVESFTSDTPPALPPPSGTR